MQTFLFSRKKSAYSRFLGGSVLAERVLLVSSFLAFLLRPILKVSVSTKLSHRAKVEKPRAPKIPARFILTLHLLKKDRDTQTFPFSSLRTLQQQKK
jgi:hypothetical protein